MLLYQSIDLFIEFMSGRTVINISVEHIRNTSLPGVTLCPNLVYFHRLSLLNENVSILFKQYLELIENENRNGINDNQKNLNELYNRAQNIYDNSKQLNINIKHILKNLSPFISKMNESILSSYFAQSSAYGEIDKDLIEYEHNYINYYVKTMPMESFKIFKEGDNLYIEKCSTLFSHSKSSWTDIKMVFKRFYINLKLDIHLFQSMEIMMHSPKTLPFEGHSYVNQGYEYIIKYSKWNIKRLGKGYDTDCIEYDPKIYTRNDCIFDCFQEKAKYFCQTEDFIGFYILKSTIYFEQKNLTLSRCEMKLKMKYEILEFCNGHCNKECQFTYYSYTIDKLGEKYYEDEIQLTFQHNQMPDLTIRHIPEMPLLTFFCNFCVLLGMWLGVSFVCILDSFWN